MSDSARCDLCNAEGVEWEWQTPSTVATPEEARAGKGFWAEDPRWLICNICHKLVMVGEQRVLLARAQFANRDVVAMLMANPTTDEVTVRAMRDEVASIHNAFWLHKTTYRRA